MTLVEIVVALAIIGIMASITVLAVGASDRSGAPESEARRLAARIELAADTALIEGEPVNLSWDEHSYGFAKARPAEGKSGERRELDPALRLAGPSPTGSLAIHENAGAGLATFLVHGRDSAWKVEFNGLAATAAPAPAS